MPTDPPQEQVKSAGELDAPAALLRDFLHDSGAVRVAGLVDRGAGRGAALIDCERFGAIEIEVDGLRLELAHDAPLRAPGERVTVRQLPAFDVDAQSGEVTGVIGGLEQLVDAASALASRIGGDSVVVTTYETSDPGAPLTITARAGAADAPLVMIGEQPFAID